MDSLHRSIFDFFLKGSEKMKKRLTAFMLSVSLLFSSLFIPFFSVSAFASSSDVPTVAIGWETLFWFIIEGLGNWALDKTADAAYDYAVDRLTGSGRAITDKEASRASDIWDNFCKQSHLSDEELRGFQEQVRAGNLDLSGKVGSALKKYISDRNGNVQLAWDDFIKQNADVLDGYNRCPNKWDIESVRSWLRGFVLSPAIKAEYGNINVGDVVIEDKVCKNFVGNIPCYCGTYNNTSGWGEYYTVGYYSSSDYTFHFVGNVNIDRRGSKYYLYNGSVPYSSAKIIYASDSVAEDLQKKGINGNFSSIYSDHGVVDTLPVSGVMPSSISSNNGILPSYYDNTLSNTDSSKNDYTTSPATIDWSKIFDDTSKDRPIFKKKIGKGDSGDTLPDVDKLKKDGSNYKDVVKQLKEVNKKLAKILGWLADFDGDNIIDSPVSDSDFAPIIDGSPLFNFKLSEKFPFSLPFLCHSFQCSLRYSLALSADSSLTIKRIVFLLTLYCFANPFKLYNPVEYNSLISSLCSSVNFFRLSCIP